MNGRQDKRDRRAQRLAQALKANLGRFPGQDDEDLMAVIPWD